MGDKREKPGAVAQIGRAVFGVSLLLPMIMVALLCLVLRGLSSAGILAVRTREGLSLLLVQASWRLSLLLCPWVWVTAAPGFGEGCAALAAARSAARARGESTAFFVLSNHTSFLDTIIAVARLPSSVVYNCRTYMATHLFNLPVLSTICIACGHFPVGFTGTKDGDFSVDRAAMDKTQARVDAHIRAGGILVFFPEGQMNKDPTSIMAWRYGGMKKALEFDAHLYMFLTCGLENIWPRWEQLGGFPGSARCSMSKFGAGGCRALAAELKKGDGAASKEKEDHAALAVYGQVQMQKEYDVMLGAVGGKGTKSP